MKHLLLACLLTFISPQLFATNADAQIHALYSKMQKIDANRIDQRITFLSKQFLQRPYQLGPLGEGQHGTIDQDPLYRTDKFDCFTYVSTVLALANARNLPEFKKNMLAIRYHNGSVHFAKRNHFTSLDWNLNNQRKGYLKDITPSLSPKVAFAYTQINKPAWYKKLDPQLLNSERKLSTAQIRKRQQALNNISKHSQIKTASISYIPLHVLFNKRGKIDRDILRRIPQGSVIELINPGVNYVSRIGTALHVTHMGFVIKKNGKYYLRHASALQNKIIDDPLIAYIKARWHKNKNMGIHIECAK